MSNRLMLSVSGCRGVVGETLTPAVASAFAGAFGSWLCARVGGRATVPTVVVGRDGRAGGQMVASAAVSGLLASGCNVVDLGVAMTPTVAVMTDEVARRANAAGRVAGLVITASHNPQQWNGLKCLLAEGGEFGSAACAPPAACANEIIERFQSGGAACRAWAEVGTLTHETGAVETHVARVMGALRDAGVAVGGGVKVAVDAVNGSGAPGARAMLRALGCEAVVLGEETTGIFSHPPEPTRENLSAPGGICDVVRREGCAVGFAQDPDADRLAIIDERGVYIGEEYTLVLSAWALLFAMGERAKGARFVTNLSTSRMLDDVAGWFGARVERTPVGEAHVVSAMKRTDGAAVICGGEGNGGTIWPRVAYVRDSLSAMALVLGLVHKEGASLSKLVSRVPAYAIEKRKVDLAKKEDAAKAVEAIARAYAAQRVDTSDGAWVGFEKGPLAGRAWLHVRASNTEPIMRLIAEAPTAREANEVLDEASGAIARGAL